MFVSCCCKDEFKRLRKLLRKEINKGFEKIMPTLAENAATIQAAFDATNASLNNISEDQANLTKQITDLKDQIASGGSNLTLADQAALDSLVVNAQALATKTAGIAAAVPDLPAAPTV